MATPCRSPSAHTRSRSGAQLDRFIPNRGAMDADIANFTLNAEDFRQTEANVAAEVVSPSKEEYRRRLAEGLVAGDSNCASRILAFKSKAPAAPAAHDGADPGLYAASGTGARPAAKKFRQVNTAPERILDAPDLVDDYYLNLLDWSSTNQVAIALANTVYLWDASSGGITELMTCQQEENYVTAVKWAADGKHLSIGTANAEVQLWDCNRAKQIRSLRGHTARVSALAWNGHTLSSGGRDSLILNHDVRVRDHVITTLRGHEQEVCGLAWSPSGNQLASGGNDNLLNVWDAASGFGGRDASALHTLTAHRAAVKALAWCPFQSNLLASGGGSSDRCIRFWNTTTGALLNTIDTGSQVCALQWNRHEKEILSSHGYSRNELCLWKYPTMSKVAELTGHSARVLHMAQSPDGTAVVSAAADETLRFWRVFGEPAGSKKASAAPRHSALRSRNIR
ncbi:unnamed protein product [Pedinophyceae sp. YPF-701]|nr:unnamed protein product [Pedinophyceae sp. YPF-701]